MHNKNIKARLLVSRALYWRYAGISMKYFLPILTLFTVSAFATMPAILVPLNSSNIEQYGFKVEIQNDAATISFSLIVPPVISNNWHLIGTQSESFTGKSLGFLAKSSVPKSNESANVSVHYKKGTSDASVGVYYQCIATSEYGCGANKQKFFYIQSVNSYGVKN